MIHLFLNCDEYLSALAVAKLKSGLGDSEMADLNTTVLTAPQTSGSDILGEASMMPFLAAKRLVMVHGYLSNLDKRAAAGKESSSSAHLEAADFFERLLALPDTCELVLFEDGLDKRRQLYRGYTYSGDGEQRKVPGVAGLIKAGHVQLHELKAPDAKNLAGYIAQWTRKREIAIDGRAIRLLADYVGADLRRLDNELDKLATYARGRTVNEGDVKLLVSDASEALIWNLTDALSQRNGRVAMRSLCELRRSDANPFYLLTMIARQYRIIIKVKEASARGAGNEYDIAKVVKESPFPVKKALQQCRKYTFEQLDEIMFRLLQTDYAMKTGADPDTEIDVLIAELTT